MLVLESNIDSTTPTFDATDSQEQTMLIVQQVLREVLRYLQRSFSTFGVQCRVP